METIHIFDEYKKEYKSEQTLHNKRTQIEPLIYDILKRKYFNVFEQFWRKNSILTHSNKSIVLIERRIHPNLSFILRNMFYYARDWSITIICSDINYEYIKTICTNNKDNIHIIKYFSGNPSREVAIKEYNNLLKLYDFYESLPYEHLFIVQTDTYLRKPIDERMFEYDYVAAPWSWDFSSAGGGMSYRKKSVMLELCKKFKGDFESEDGFINEGIKALGYKMPDYLTGMKYICESTYYIDPMGVHQWWTFFEKDAKHAELIFHKYLELEILKE